MRRGAALSETVGWRGRESSSSALSCVWYLTAHLLGLSGSWVLFAAARTPLHAFLQVPAPGHVADPVGLRTGSPGALPRLVFPGPLHLGMGTGVTLPGPPERICSVPLSGQGFGRHSAPSTPALSCFRLLRPPQQNTPDPPTSPTHLLLTVWRLQVQDGDAANSVSSKSSLLGLQTAACSLWLHVVQREGEREGEFSVSLLARTLIPLDQRATLMTSFNLNSFLPGQLPWALWL